MSTLLVLALLGALTHAVTDRTLGPADLRIELGAPEAGRESARRGG